MVNVAVDNVGAEVMQRSFEAMAVYGRLVTLMGTPGDTSDEVAYNNNLSIHNVMMLTPMWRGLFTRLHEQAQMVRKGLDWLGRGELKVHVGRTCSLEDACDAHRLLEMGGSTGKIVLTID